MQCSYCNNIKWKLPEDFRFNIPKDTLLFDDKNADDILKCPSCNRIGRPNVLMFDDTTFIYNIESYTKYKIWELAVEKLIRKTKNISFIILEIGCGKRVSSMRDESNDIVRDIILKSGDKTEDGRPTIKVIRVNPEEPECDYPEYNDYFISIKDKGLNFLQNIDKIINNKN